MAPGRLADYGSGTPWDLRGRCRARIRPKHCRARAVVGVEALARTLCLGFCITSLGLGHLLVRNPDLSATIAFAKKPPSERSPEARARELQREVLQHAKLRSRPRSMSLSSEIGKDEEGAPEYKAPLLPGFTRCRLRVAYDGSNYCGWARVKNGPLLTVSGMVDRAVSFAVKHNVYVQGASRTDAGVHGRGQAAHFDLPEDAAAGRPHDWQALWEHQINQKLPSDVRVRALGDAPSGFHASISAAGKTYAYRLHVGDNPPDPLDRFYRCCLGSNKALGVDGRIVGENIDRLRSAGERFIGCKDFSCFTPDAAAYASRTKAAVRTVHSITVVEEGPGNLRIEVSLDGALYRMVRNIVGCMLAVASGRMALDSIDELLDNPPKLDEDHAWQPPFACMPPEGLCLENVYYHDDF
ncbi:unnamed protein product [Polarella glacialis]|uniref:tRNA pseudouridine synthase n=1 Tax=Polarella glacialis TaxID=89957 RepID=A0A813GFA2_POLGL|nr:unnamed protein product [Polarella glacialis]